MNFYFFGRLKGWLNVVFCAVFLHVSVQAVDVVRTLPTHEVCSASNYVTSLDISFPADMPGALILIEVLPADWVIVDASWNGSSFAPTVSGQTNKWVFGFSPPVQEGILTYTVAPTNVFERTYDISGIVRYLNGGSEVEPATGGDVALSSCDTDNDGIPDDWELLYGLSPTNAVDAAANWDDDPMNNLQEYLADTNPTNGASSLLITDLQVQNGEAVVSWKGGQNSVQYFESTSDLMTNSWQCLRIFSPPVATTNQAVITNTPAQMYFRIRSAR